MTDNLLNEYQFENRMIGESTGIAEKTSICSLVLNTSILNKKRCINLKLFICLQMN